MLSPFHPAQMALGLIVWSVYFVVLYSALSIGCAALDPEALAPVPFNRLSGGLLALTLVAGLWLLYGAWRCWRVPSHEEHPDPAEVRQREPGGGQLRHSRRFIASVGTGVYLIAGLATLGVGAPIAILMPCI